jgi:hypothetical protein
VREWEREREETLTRAQMRSFYKHMTAEVARLTALAAEVRAARAEKAKGKAAGAGTRAKDVLAAIQADSKSPLAEQCERMAAVAAFWCCVVLTGQRVAQLLEAREEKDEIGGEEDGTEPREVDILVLMDTKGRRGHEKPVKHVLPITPRLADHWRLARNAKHANIYTVRGAASTALKKIAPGRSPLDIRRTVETALQRADVSRSDRADLLSHGRSGIQAKVYERSAQIEQKLRALAALEKWVCGDVAAAQAPETAAH